MAKRKTPKSQKIVDLKSEATHITTDELTPIQKIVGEINRSKMEIGGVELRKHELLHLISTLQEELGKLQKTLNEKYGDVDIDITNGEIKGKENGEVNS
tara:strand:- start:38 stop:334 length:297 start_codon:yes stop_codon:yes gene_type:complete